MSRDFGKERVIAMISEIGEIEMYDFELEFGRKPSMQDDGDIWLLAAFLIYNMRAYIEHLESKRKR